MKERAILVTPRLSSLRGEEDPENAAGELEALAASAGLEVAGHLIFRQKAPNARLFLGKGKAEEVALLVRGEKADVVVFETDLSGTQQRNLEEIVHAKTIDRTQLILDIFAQRARSLEGKLQVELAQIKYLLPRLAGKGIYLSRLGGGVGTRGPGEQKLEMDRRRVRERITRLARELEELQRRRSSGLLKKKEKETPIVALVGYTNAGKSSLFNRLTQASTKVEDRLFSTLDTTTRQMELGNKQKALLVDTVGFIRNLPHHLIESFKATLEEAAQADLLLHVIDASRADTFYLRKAVEQVLVALGISGKKSILVWNKADLLEKTQPAADPEGGVFLSAKTGEGVEGLISELTEYLSYTKKEQEFFVPVKYGGLIHFLYEKAEVLGRRDGQEGSFLRVRISRKAEEIFKKMLRDADQTAKTLDS